MLGESCEIEAIIVRKGGGEGGWMAQTFYTTSLNEWPYHFAHDHVTVAILAQDPSLVDAAPQAFFSRGTPTTAKDMIDAMVRFISMTRPASGSKPVLRSCVADAHVVASLGQAA